MTCLLITVPNSGSITTQTVGSLIGLTQALTRKKIPFSFRTYEFSDLVFSRNQLMSYFHTDAKFTHCLLLDSDLSFTPKAFFRLFDFDVDFAAATYPQRRVTLHQFRKAVEEELQKPEEERATTDAILAGSYNYVWQKILDKDKKWVAKNRGDFSTVPGVGAGFILIKRAVPEQMVAQKVARHLPRLETLPLHRGLKYHDYFSHLLDADKSVMYGEDQSFCRRWVEGCAGDIWLDRKSKLTHHGQFSYKGDASLIK